MCSAFYFICLVSLFLFATIACAIFLPGPSSTYAAFKSSRTSLGHFSVQGEKSSFVCKLGFRVSIEATIYSEGVTTLCVPVLL